MNILSFNSVPKFNSEYAFTEIVEKTKANNSLSKAFYNALEESRLNGVKEADLLLLNLDNFSVAYGHKRFDLPESLYLLEAFNKGIPVFSDKLAPFLIERSNIEDIKEVCENFENLYIEKTRDGNIKKNNARINFLENAIKAERLSNNAVFLYQGDFMLDSDTGHENRNNAFRTVAVRLYDNKGNLREGSEELLNVFKSLEQNGQNSNDLCVLLYAGNTIRQKYGLDPMDAELMTKLAKMYVDNKPILFSAFGSYMGNSPFYQSDINDIEKLDVKYSELYSKNPNFVKDIHAKEQIFAKSLLADRIDICTAYILVEENNKAITKERSELDQQELNNPVNDVPGDEPR